MNFKNISKFFLIALFVFFLSLLFANMSGYYNTKSVREQTLTDAQIKKFEEDVSSGKSVDIKDYLSNEDKDYSTSLSTKIYEVSIKLEKIVDSTLNYVFNGAGRLVSD